eukprot:jgi/Tetstr1/437699/TSEL_026354.t1
MIVNHRTSILNRPLKPATKNNVEAADIEHARQEDYWRGKSERYADTEDRIRRSIYPDKDSKTKDQASVRETMEQQLQEIHCRRATELHERAESYMPEQVTADHPWAHNTEDTMQQNIVDIRRRMAREAMEENQRLVYLRREQARQEEIAEKERIKQATQNEDSWWNYGAASERWVPPEHRPRTHTGSGATAGPSQAPYSWAPEASAAPPAPRAPAMEKKSYPWSWDA